MSTKTAPKPFFHVKALFCGWWYYLNVDGDFREWKGSEPIRPKQFKTFEAAKKASLKIQASEVEVLKLTHPTPPAITYPKEVVFQLRQPA